MGEGRVEVLAGEGLGRWDLDQDLFLFLRTSRSEMENKAERGTVFLSGEGLSEGERKRDGNNPAHKLSIARPKI